MQARAPEVKVREVTNEEVHYFHENGWAFLPRLIGPEVARGLLDRAKKLMGDTGTSQRLERASDQDGYTQYFRPDREDPLFKSVAHGWQLGRNAALLLGRELAMISMANLVIVKPPVGVGVAEGGKAETEYHQDHGFPIRGETMAFWIALTEITPDMGSMRFYEGSHKLGWLSGDPLDWPRLHDECSLSAPLTYQPGDATIHGSLVVHGSPENATERSRFGYVANFSDANAEYTGGPSFMIDPFRDQIEVGKPLNLPEFPVVYTPRDFENTHR